MKSAPRLLAPPDLPAFARRVSATTCAGRATSWKTRLAAPVTAYRAASFSITARSLWALEILVEEGFKVDSSIFPIRHDRYGIPGARLGPHQLTTAAGTIWEFPPAVVRLAGIVCRSAGADIFGFFRCLGRCIVFAGSTATERQPFVCYVHPWEFDPDQPRLRGSRLARFRHYVNLSKNARKLDVLLGQFRFGRLRDLVARKSTTTAPTAAAGKRPRQCENGVIRPGFAAIVLFGIATRLLVLGAGPSCPRRPRSISPMCRGNRLPATRVRAAARPFPARPLGPALVPFRRVALPENRLPRVRARQPVIAGVPALVAGGDADLQSCRS